MIIKIVNEVVDIHMFNGVCLLIETEAQSGNLKNTSLNKNWIRKLQ